jgi:RNA polymerase sigma-70 factor, ECF subfamily
MDATRQAIDALYRAESGRITATLIRLVGDFGLAEEVVHDAFAAAVEQWPLDVGLASPRAWIIQTARNKAIDRIRRRAKHGDKVREIAELMQLEAELADEPERDEDLVDDDRLRLIFTCCHPALAVEAQVALTLRTLCGLSTEEIARAFLVPAPTMAQRLVRAKGKIRDARIPYRIPALDVLPERIEAVMAVVYLVFNEGYAATSGDALLRRELTREAIRLARLLHRLLPREREIRGLLALLLLHDARGQARVDAEGNVVLLEDQDRGLWSREQIAEGLAHVEGALRAGPPGKYALQAAISALHARAARSQDTDWPQIAALYELLERVEPSAVVALNRAVAIAMADGFEHGLARIDLLEAGGLLQGYHLLHAARADLLRRLGRFDDARTAYRRALSLVTNEPERRFLERRLAGLG